MRRRALLALLGTTATAGCSTVSGLFSGERYVGLGALYVGNWDDEPHTVTVQVDADGETVLDRTLDTDARANGIVDGGRLPCAWHDAPGPYVVRARHESSEGWAELALDDGVDEPGLVRASVRVGYPDQDGDIEILRLLGDVTDCRVETPTTPDTPKENAF
ncbi:hypothetical protein [Halomarina oriensis]|uniref:Lipoprotein n=1 Tax=Halomarina oriensis TaxID=671145 RepID=A0A6B0GIB8_9EURY|nr:hypothetical protein [Halomarina oriensis]MWG34616.1 hypothetical protein [Halomarina oriensis]